VEDCGCGFDADAPTVGYGLVGMQERPEQIGATVTVVTEDRMVRPSLWLGPHSCWKEKEPRHERNRAACCGF
jgi:signal transduction histidine kinase